MLVDDRDGRVLLEIPDPIEAFRLLDELRLKAPTWPTRSADARQCSLVGTETTPGCGRSPRTVEPLSSDSEQRDARSGGRTDLHKRRR